MKVLVTGAEEHQGLSVIRGLGQAGVEVVAAAGRRHSLGFASRYASECHCYRSPRHDVQGFVADVLAIIEQTRPDVVLPAVESTLVALDAARERIEERAVLAAPPSHLLSFAVDQLKTVRLAERIGLPVPATVHADTAMELLCQAARLRFPVVVKPRGNGQYRGVEHPVPLRVRYARDFVELREILTPVAASAWTLLVQEYVPGTARCVSAVCDYGEPVAMFAYDRRREWPHSGGIGVMRRSIPLDHLLYTHAVTLLRSIGWRGIGMIEFKYDAATRSYTLLGFNAQFQTSTALSVDAGLNLPYLVAALFAGRLEGQPHMYTLGVEERWLRGDLLALLETLEPRVNGRSDGRAIASLPGPAAPSRWSALVTFARDFRRGVKYDEFKLSDWRPGVIAAFGLAGALAGWAGRFARRLGTAAAERVAAWVARHRLWPTLGSRSGPHATFGHRAARLAAAGGGNSRARNLPNP